MSIAWLLFEVYLVGSFVSAIMVLSACLLSARLPEKGPKAIASPSKRSGAMAPAMSRGEQKIRTTAVDLAVRFSPFGL